MADENIKEYKAGTLLVKIDQSKCLSCGACAVVAAQTFELDENLVSKVKQQGPYDAPEIIKQAVTGCPSGAITIEDI